MRAVIVAGDRHARIETWRPVVETAIVSPVVVIHGNASGIDAIAHMACVRWKGREVIPVPAQWERYGNAAGPKRNVAMLAMLNILRDHGYDVAVLAFHDDLPNSKGTGHMVRIAREADIPVRHFTSDGRESAA